MERSIEKKKTMDVMPFVILFSLMILDFILTSIGISLGVIIEGNFLMGWLMALPFAAGLLVKTGMSIILLTPIYYAKLKNKRIYKVALWTAFIAYGIIMVMHALWIALII